MKKQKKETFDTLWEYCSSDNRVCPVPLKWNELFNKLKAKDGLNLPLILNSWEMSSPLEKLLRFQEHIKYASEQNQLDEIGSFLRLLTEEDWAHYGEI